MDARSGGSPFTPFGEASRSRPTDEMLENIDLLVFDIQDIGSRSYTYMANLFMCMEEAAKAIYQQSLFSTGPILSTASWLTARCWSEVFRLDSLAT